MTSPDETLARLSESTDRMEAEFHEFHAALAERGLPVRSPIITGERARLAAEQLQAANKEQGEILELLLKLTDHLDG